MRLFTLLAVLVPAAPLLAQLPSATSPRPSAGAVGTTAEGRGPGPITLDLATIMRGPELYGREPQQVRWTADGRWIYFRWNEPGTDWREELQPYRVRATAGATPERVTEAHMDSVGPLVQPGRLSRDRTRRVVSYQGDLFVVDLGSGAARRLTETLAPETDPAFSADGRLVYYVRDNNVHSIALDGGLVRQVTDVRAGPAPREPARAEGQRAALEAQQRELFGAVRDRLRADSLERAERREREARRGKTLWLDPTERVTSLSVSPDGRSLLLVTTVPTDRALNTKVPNWVTASGYTEDLNTRTKVGDAQSRGRVAFVRLPSGEATFLKPTPGDTTRPASFVAALGWNEAGTHALLMSQSGDFKTRWLMTVDADSGALRTVDVLRDSAWVAGPCFGCGGWYPDAARGAGAGQRVWFVGEADGYAHLYTMNADGTDRRQLTSGRFEVTGVALSRDGRSFWLTTSEVSPFERHFYRMPVEGGARTRITARRGAHAVALSPDERLLADVHSTANQPPELFLMANRPDAPMAQLTTSPTAAWLAQPWIRPEIVHVPASDGAQVPARIYRPKDVGAEPNGAAVIFVHGAGYLQNVHEWWSSYSREYMFHHLLAARGYVVLDLDYRASAGYGRDWRTAIYRFMGGRDLQDHVDASRWLRAQHGIAPERVGIYGGSYGGFITLMALFTEGEHFGAGAALRSVTDWAHYNHGYTGRILNLPQSDSTAYRRSSPIYHAAGLNDPLLMAHGMVDVNVHFSDIVRLTQRLIELGKTDWELAVYPVEDHAFVRPDSWTDEYRRILELFERHLHGKPRATPATSGAGR